MTEMTLAIKGKLECTAHMEKAEDGWHILSLLLQNYFQIFS